MTFPLLWEGAVFEGALHLQLPDQVCACPGVLSTQVVFSEPADLNILYLTRRWFGPCSPAVLAGGSPTADTTACASEGRWVKRGQGRDWLRGDTVKEDGEIPTWKHPWFYNLLSAWSSAFYRTSVWFGNYSDRHFLSCFLILILRVSSHEDSGNNSVPISGKWERKTAKEIERESKRERGMM